jgi:hypothetical protein
MERYSTHER